MNAQTARRIAAQRAFRASGSPRPIIMGSVVITTEETALGPKGLRGIIADITDGRKTVRLHDGRRVIIADDLLEAV